RQGGCRLRVSRRPTRPGGTARCSR
ncbi:Ras family protein, partial [Streptomyces ipomoeae 91-03]